MLSDFSKRIDQLIKETRAAIENTSILSQKISRTKELIESFMIREKTYNRMEITKMNDDVVMALDVDIIETILIQIENLVSKISTMKINDAEIDPAEDLLNKLSDLTVFDTNKEQKNENGESSNNTHKEIIEVTEEFKSGSNTVKSLEEEDRKVKADIITENEDKTPKKAANFSNNSEILVKEQELKSILDRIDFLEQQDERQLYADQNRIRNENTMANSGNDSEILVKEQELKSILDRIDFLEQQDERQLDADQNRIRNENTMANSGNDSVITVNQKELNLILSRIEYLEEEEKKNDEYSKRKSIFQKNGQITAKNTNNNHPYNNIVDGGVRRGKGAGTSKKIRGVVFNALYNKRKNLSSGQLLINNHYFKK